MNPITPAPHLDHMLRQTQMHHVQLSSMADVKANIMLTLAAVVTTFSIGYLTEIPVCASGVPDIPGRAFKQWRDVCFGGDCAILGVTAVSPSIRFNLLIQTHLHTIRSVHPTK